VFNTTDLITFDDTASVFIVSLAEDVEPSSIAVNTAGSYSFVGSGAIVGGTLTLTGGGTLELANDGNTYDGETDVQDGTLVVSSSTGTGDTTVQSGATLEGGGTVGGNLTVQSGATIRPGGEQFSTLTVAGDYTQLAGATLEVELLSAVEFDTLVVTGNTLLGGALDVQLAGEFVPSLGDTFDILTVAGSVNGMFGGTLFPDLGALLAMDLVYDTNSVTLAIVPALPGDFDIDGDVDGFDFLLWQRGGSPDPLSQSDLDDWEANYGMVATLSASSAAVPEPNSLALLCLGGLLALRSFRRVTPFTA
jgi:autotransporter-associated beta strand protein